MRALEAVAVQVADELVLSLTPSRVRAPGAVAMQVADELVLSLATPSQ
jgi:hypothetical protein